VEHQSKGQYWWIVSNILDGEEKRVDGHELHALDLGYGQDPNSIQFF